MASPVKQDVVLRDAVTTVLKKLFTTEAPPSGGEVGKAKKS